MFQSPPTRNILFGVTTRGHHSFWGLSQHGVMITDLEKTSNMDIKQTISDMCVVLFFKSLIQCLNMGY